jgi:hypothetical protein
VPPSVKGMTAAISVDSARDFRTSSRQVAKHAKNHCRKYGCTRARELLMTTVVEYRPESPIQDLVWLRGHDVGSDRRNVTELWTHRLRAVRNLSATPVIQ